MNIDATPAALDYIRQSISLLVGLARLSYAENVMIDGEAAGARYFITGIGERDQGDLQIKVSDSELVTVNSSILGRLNGGRLDLSGGLLIRIGNTAGHAPDASSPR